MKHPYNYSGEKNLMQKLIDFGLPLFLFLLFFQFYNFGKISPSEMVKTSGLLAISLLGITLIIGPLSRIFPQLEFLKAHRTDDEELYQLVDTRTMTLNELNQAIEEWTEKYNTKRLHFSLNFVTPEKYLMSHI